MTKENLKKWKKTFSESYPLFYRPIEPNNWSGLKEVSKISECCVELLWAVAIIQ